MEFTRRQLMLSGLATAAGSLLPLGGSAAADDGKEKPAAVPHPQIADTSAASDELVEFMTSFFTAKSNHDVDGTMAHFAPDMVTYIDAILGWDEAGFDILKAVFAQFMPTWPPSGKSYPTRIIGDLEGGALIAFTDTPELFGGELRILGALNFKHGKIFRWIDHWDWRSFDNLFGLTRTPLTNYREAVVGERASARLQRTARQLAAALSSGDANAAAALFSSDAVYEDMTLRAQVLGQIEIRKYLARVVAQLPFGTGAALRHVVGWNMGGGFEWNGAPASGVRTGVSALLLDRKGLITRMTSVYDGSLLPAGEFQALVALAVDP